MPSKDRNEIAEAANETVKILKSGKYTATDPVTKADVSVDIKDALRAACEGTEFHPHDAPLRLSNTAYHTDVQVTKETTLECAKRLAKDASNGRIAILNFASARHPGGGFQRGSWAQEESIATCSGLYACLTTPQAKKFYDVHDTKKQGGRGGRKPMSRFFGGSKKASAGTPAPASTSLSAKPTEPPYHLYTSNIVFSPNVPVIRNERNLELVSSPFTCSVITSCAVNFNVGMFAKKKMTIEEKEFPLKAMQVRALRVLQVACHHGVNTLVLGAWGCGVFKNDPYDIAKIFKGALLHPDMEYAFQRVILAVPDDPKNPDTNFWFTKEFAKEKVDPRKKAEAIGLPKW